MGYKIVYRSLTELFPQVDARLLKAVAIEHPKDANEAAAVVISEIVPKFYPTLSDNSTQPGNKTPANVPDNKVERGMQNGTLTGSEMGASSSGTNPLTVDCDHETRAPITNLLSNRNQLTNVIQFGDLNIQSKAKISLGGSVESGVVSSDPPAFVQVGTKLTRDGCQTVDFHIIGNKAESSTSAVSEDAVHKVVYPADNSTITQESSRLQFRFGSLDDVKETSSGSLAGENSAAELSSSLAGENSAAELSSSLAGENSAAELSSSLAGENSAAELSSSLAGENSAAELSGSLAGENSAAELSSSLAGEKSAAELSGSLAGENSAAELSGSNLVDETSNDSFTIENDDAELCGAFSSVVSRSTQGCNIDHLERIIEDAKSNKKTLFTVMESIMNLMREVESQEKDAEKVKEDATRGGFDTLVKVEELKKMLAHAKEANDMDAGEVYGERSILTTEVNELENRLLSLSEERDKSLAVLDEMRGVLETRLAAALEIKNTAEQIKQEKEGSARKALAEQEVIMDKVVQESKLLQQEAEENSKLREFLMDRGRTVDSLQGEISVICQDIRILKEKFDNRVPLSLSITSSQTSCKLASSGSSMKSVLLEKPLEPPVETPEASGNNNNKSPKKALVNERKDNKHKELLEDGWDIFDKETEM